MKRFAKNCSILLSTALVLHLSCKKEKYEDPDLPVDVCNTNTRSVVNARLTPLGSLSLARIEIGCTSIGSKLIFAAGEFDNGAEFQPSTRVDIYDTITKFWSTAELSAGHVDIKAAVAGGKVFFAGGRTAWGSDWDLYHIIDIYEPSANTWTTKHLPEARMDLSVSAIGNKIFFAGGRGGTGGGPPGTPSDRVDILDLSTNLFTTKRLSVGRISTAAVASGTKIYYAGGSTNNCEQAPTEIYDVSTDTWTKASLREPLYDVTGVTADNKVFFAGGQRLCNSNLKTSLVQIRDISTGKITYDCLFAPRSGFDAGIKGNKIIFFTGSSNSNRFDIYDLKTKTWSIGVLPPGYNGTVASMMSVNNTLYVTGLLINGYLSDVVWKLDL